MLRRLLLLLLVALLAASLASASSRADPLATLSIGDVTIAEGDTGTVAATFTVTLSAPSNDTVTVDYATADSQATSPEDYAASAATLSFDPNEVSKQVTVLVNGDSVHEASEGFFVNLSNPVFADLGDAQGAGTITNDDPAPELSIDDVTVAEGNSSTVSATFTVSLIPASGQSVTVDYASADGTGTAPADYANTNGTLSFAAGETAKQVTVPVNGDLIDEINESFSLNLTNPGNASLSDAQGLGTITDDDPLPTVAIGDVTVTEQDTGTVTASFNVTLVPASGHAVSVQYATADGTATAPADYSATGGALVFAAGETTKQVTVPVHSDTLDEIDESFTVTLTNPTNASIADGIGLGTIADNDPLPTLVVNDVTVAEGDTGTTAAVFTVTLGAPTGRAASVNFATANGTATTPADYANKSGILTFAAGETTKQVTVLVNGDLLPESNETYTLNLSNATNATILDPSGTGTITDGDPIPSLVIEDRSVSEGDNGPTWARFTVRLSAPSGQNVTVQYATANGTATAPADYRAETGTVTFAPGDLTKEISIRVEGETIPEVNEVYFVNLSNATNATIVDAQAVGTIIDDDGLPMLSIDDVTVLEGNSGTVDATFTVSLSRVSGQTVSVGYATADGSAIAGADYTTSGGSLVFNPGQVTRTLTVPVTSDTLDEVDETFFVNLANPVNAAITDGQGLGTITDDDGVTSVSVDDVTVTEGNGAGVNANFTVSLSAASGQSVSVQYATQNGTATAPADYAALPLTTITFSPGQVTRTVTVTVAGDLLDESDESFTLNLSNAVNATISDPTGLGTITDNDQPPGLSVNDVTIAEGNTGTVAATFAVTLNAPSGRAVSVDYATANNTATAPADYAAASATLDFAAGQVTRQVTVLVNGDGLDEVNETYFLNLSNATNATIADGSGVGTITDDDPAPSLSISNQTVTEGNSGTVDASFTVTLNTVSGRAVTVDYATGNGTATSPADYTAVPQTTLTFDPGQTTRTVTVSVNGDQFDEPDETFDVILSGAVGATIGDGLGVGTITDDDPQPALSVNDVTVTEGNTGTTTATFTVSLSSPSGRAVSVQFATANGTAVAPADYAAATGTVTFTPGQATRTFAVQVAGDTTDEITENYFVNLTNAVNATIADAQGVGTIIDNDGVQELFVNDVTVTEGQSGTVNASFTVSLSAPSGQSVSVGWASADGTATAPADYTPGGGNLVFTPGQTTRTVMVSVKGDMLDESDETFTVRLSDPTNATISDGLGLGTITDDDALPGLSVNDVTVTEGDVGTVAAVFTVSLNAPSGRQVTVAYTTADGSGAAGSDYVAANGVLAFAAGETTKTVAVTVTGDLLDEVDETYVLTLASPENAALTDGHGLGTITDDDLAPTPPPPPPPPPAPQPPPPPPARLPATRKVSALFSPVGGARLTAPPLLRWRGVPKVHHFNVQVYRNGRKILSRWPTKPRLKLRSSWKEHGRTYRLRPGVYTWIVWPAYTRTRYGRMLGQSSFRIVKR